METFSKHIYQVASKAFYYNKILYFTSNNFFYILDNEDVRVLNNWEHSQTENHWTLQWPKTTFERNMKKPAQMEKVSI